MDGMPEQRAATFRRPLSPPGHVVIRGSAPPGSLDGGQIGCACQTLGDERFQLLQSVAKAVLKDGHDATPRAGLDADQLIHLAQRADEWLLADGMFARGQHLLNLLEVQVRGRADVDHVDVHAAQLGQVGHQTWDVMLLGNRASPIGVDVTQRDHLEALGHPRIAADVRRTDTGADYAYPQPFRGRHHAATAWGRADRAAACARKASSEARNAWACVIAVSVRLRTSSSSRGPNGRSPSRQSM